MPSGPGLYSRIVAILKVGLPLVALGMLASLFLVQTDDRVGGDLVFSPGDLAALGEGLRISNPVFTGTTRSQDSFRFTATLVVPDAAPPTRAQITALAGEIDLSDGPEIALASDTGDLDIPTQRLDMIGDVRIDTSDGYSIRSERATLDLRAGSIIASQAVESTGPLGRIDSGSLRVAPAAENGEARHFSFGDGVRLLYQPPPTD
jgi:lipopolysaccharide export system protein LptC